MGDGWKITAYVDRAGKTWRPRPLGGWTDTNGIVYLTIGGLDAARGPLTESAVDNVPALIADYLELEAQASTASATVAALAAADHRLTLVRNGLMVMRRHLLGVSRRCPDHDIDYVADCTGCEQAARVEQVMRVLDALDQPVPVPQ